MNVLLVKMSSLGDIVHTLPALDDAVRRGVRFDWVVEENYGAVPALARGVDRVLEVAFRRWRTAPFAYHAELRAFRQRLRQRRYDLVLDAQGLLKSAVVASWTHAGQRVGFDAGSVRERVATLAYDRGITVPRKWHAIDRTRRLFADALDYERPEGEPVFDLCCRGRDVGTRAGREVVLAHGTTWPTKHWPEAFWTTLAGLVNAHGFNPVLPWANGERGRAERIAKEVPGARICPRLDLAGVIRLLADASGVVGVDSGLAHLGGALGRPTVMLFGPSDPSRTGGRGPFVRNLAASLPCSPCGSRRCRLGRELGTRYEARGSGPPCLEAVAPARAWAALTELMDRHRRGRVA
ncbi:MAG: lipopolysaccharide heptosyltransferase I [Gammaproteobacteria bacterium]|nr:lipopolysaccharide heptosyltransferase I [Gammaproteobacteria bacterium]